MIDYPGDEVARAAFAVLVRSELVPIVVSDGRYAVLMNSTSLGRTWVGYTSQGRQRLGERLEWPDPFTALVEAEKWRVEHLEGLYGP